MLSKEEAYEKIESLVERFHHQLPSYKTATTTKRRRGSTTSIEDDVGPAEGRKRVS